MEKVAEEVVVTVDQVVEVEPPDLLAAEGGPGVVLLLDVEVAQLHPGLLGAGSPEVQAPDQPGSPRDPRSWIPRVSDSQTTGYQITSRIPTTSWVLQFQHLHNPKHPGSSGLTWSDMNTLRYLLSSATVLALSPCAWVVEMETEMMMMVIMVIMMTMIVP